MVSKKRKKARRNFLGGGTRELIITWISSDQKKPKVVCRLKERKTPKISVSVRKKVTG